MFLLSRLTEIYLRFPVCFENSVEIQVEVSFMYVKMKKFNVESSLFLKCSWTLFSKFHECFFIKIFFLRTLIRQHSHSGEGWSWILFSCLGFLWRSKSEMLTENASHKWSTASSFIMNCENTFFCCYDTGSCERGKKIFIFNFTLCCCYYNFPRKSC